MQTINFIYLVGENTSSFSIIHYISLKSFACNNEAKIRLFTNAEPTYSPWYHRLFSSIKGEQFEVLPVSYILEAAENKLEDFHEYEQILRSIEKPAHKVDLLRLLLLYAEGGLFSDLDMICLKKLPENLLSGTKPTYPVELDFEHHFNAIPNGFMYHPAGHSWTKKLLELYKNYNSESWNETSIMKPTELYFESKEQINIIPAGLIDPACWFERDRVDLLMHNQMRFDDSYTFHLSESANHHFLKWVDLEHIMTVHTTFTHYVRRYVSEYWDHQNYCPKISKYE